MTLSQHLRQTVEIGRLPHAVLLAGSDNAGLREQALLLAAAHNCEAPQNLRPCRECLSCRKTESLQHPDVTVLDCAESSVPVKRVRLMCATLPVLPNEGRVKPYLLYDAQLLNPACQNALLDALEEPPSASAFILTCDRPDALLPTVRSRLVRWDIRGAGETSSFSGGAAADAILRALDRQDELALLTASVGCESMSRDQVSLLLDVLRSGLMERCERLPGGGISQASALLDAASALGDLQEALTRNAGVGHICGAMAVRLAGIFAKE